MGHRSNLVEKIGYAIAWAGGASYAAIFLIVLVNGRWPEFLHPIQTRFEIMARLLGGFAFMSELALFVGPGLLIATLSGKLHKA